jgi:hypothetical protein
LVVLSLTGAEERTLGEELSEKRLSAKVYERYRLIAHEREGATPSAASRVVGCSDGKAEHRVHRFNASGFDSFEKQPNHPGRPIIIDGHDRNPSHFGRRRPGWPRVSFASMSAEDWDCRASQLSEPGTGADDVAQPLLDQARRLSPQSGDVVQIRGKRRIRVCDRHLHSPSGQARAVSSCAYEPQLPANQPGYPRFARLRPERWFVGGRQALKEQHKLASHRECWRRRFRGRAVTV